MSKLHIQFDYIAQTWQIIYWELPMDLIRRSVITYLKSISDIQNDIRKIIPETLGVFPQKNCLMGLYLVGNIEILLSEANR